ncbi:hypothetical protein G6F31_017567 [Rhizopus arrhizus]|nr:hypothetical protein G6F31_017567 [Rhizopus arrhizus]
MFDISLPALLAQLLVGLINGCFYAILSMGLAIIFGLLNIVNFTHGAQFMMAAFLAWIGFTQLPQLLGPGVQINFWAALILAPLLVGAVGVVIEKTLLKRLYHLDHLADSATSTASRGWATSRPRSCRAGSTWASCSCPGTAAGPWRCRWGGAWPCGC